MNSVIDTNILVGALLSGNGINRQIIKLCFENKIAPQISNALVLEYEELFSRKEILEKSLLTVKENQYFLDDFLSICQWNEFFYKWRPNLRDESDNHLIELALASQSKFIVTHNIRDFRFVELRFPDLEILNPSQMLEVII